MSILVTGGTGFIGRYVVDRVQDRGEHTVTYDRTPTPAGLPSSVTSVQGELFDLARLAETIARQELRGIVHAAGMSDPELSLGMPAATLTANAIGTFHLLEAARLAGFGGRIVLLSSMTAYGDPRTPFAATKAFGDLLGEVYTAGYGLDVMSLRFSEVYGPGRRLPNLLEQVIDAATARRVFHVERNGDEPYQLVHVEDAARAIVAALDACSPARRVYDIVGERVRLEQVVAIVRDRVGNVDIDIDGDGGGRRDALVSCGGESAALAPIRRYATSWRQGPGCSARKRPARRGVPPAAYDARIERPGHRPPAPRGPPGPDPPGRVRGRPLRADR